MRSALLLVAPLVFVVACDGDTPATSAEDTQTHDGVSDTGDVLPEVCVGFPCTANSHCVDVDGTPTCSCDEGFIPVDATCVADSPTAPAIDNLPATSTGESGASTIFTVVAVDPNPGDTLTFSRASSTCSFEVAVSPAGEVTWTCPAAYEFCAVTIEVTDQGGLKDSGVLDIVCPNGVPSVTDVAVSPDPIPFLGTTLECDHVFRDPERDDNTSTIEWLIDGNVVSTETTFDAYAAFDDIQCRVTPRDPYGAGTAVTSPVVTAPEQRITAIAAGLSHTCAAVDNRVACWGRNVRGALGDNTTTDRASPAYITLGDQHFDSVGAIAAGDEHSCAIMDGTLKCWGSNAHSQLGVSGFGQQLVLVDAIHWPMTSVSAGKAFTCAISNARGACSGLDSDGQLGDGTNVNANGFRGVAGLPGDVTHIAAGDEHACAIANGDMYCWGKGTLGRLGDGQSTVNRTTAQKVLYLGGLTATGIACGRRHTCAILGGAAYCWGGNPDGQVSGSSNIYNVPQRLRDLTSDVTAIGAGIKFSCAIHAGALKCWGVVPGGDGNVTMPVVMGGMDNGVTQLAVGGEHVCAVHEGRMKCLGTNTYGQLGDGTTENRAEPVTVSFP